MSVLQKESGVRGEAPVEPVEKKKEEKSFCSGGQPTVTGCTPDGSVMSATARYCTLLHIERNLIRLLHVLTIFDENQPQAILTGLQPRHVQFIQFAVNHRLIVFFA